MESILHTDFDQVSNFGELFATIATGLLRSCNLVINGNVYYIRELEFYVNHTNHPDEYTHSGNDQLSCCKWYFHKTGITYKGGTFKGLDITFGLNGYGGILIRAISNGTDYIEGSCNVVNKILDLTNYKSIVDLVNSDQFTHDVFAKGIIHIVDSNTINTPICSSPRVGLSFKLVNELYTMRPYRYLSCPGKVKKGKHHLVLELYHQGHDIVTIAAITNSTAAKCNEWLHYSTNVKTKEFYCNRSLKVNEYCELYGLIRSEM